MKIKSHPFSQNSIPPFPVRLHAVGSGFLLEWALTETGDSAPDIPFVNALRKRKEIVEFGERTFTPLLPLNRIIAKCRALVPTLFIFHATRCGSTLLARMLESQAVNRVFIEPRAVTSLLFSTRRSQNQESRATHLRALIGAYGLGAPSGQRNLVFKFASLCNYHLDTIGEAFPDTARVFLYRDPIEIVAALVREPANYLGEDRAEILNDCLPCPRAELKSLDLEHLACLYLEQTFTCALERASSFSRLINYTELPQAGHELARTFLDCDIEASSAPLLGVHSKKHGVPFIADSGQKQGLASPLVRELAECRLYPLYRRLEAWRKEKLIVNHEEREGI